MSDFYEILGLNKGATIDEVKKAYRQMARKYHPDVSKESGAEDRFKKINEAYQILSNPQKKQAYDQFGAAAFGQSGGFGGDPFGSSRNYQQGPFTYTYSTSGQAPDFEDFLGGSGADIFDMFFGGRSRRPKRGRDLSYSFGVSFGEAVCGVEKEVSIGGKKLKIKIPAGSSNGLRFRFAGEGEPGPSGTSHGDLYIILGVASPREFDIRGSDIVMEREISMYQAALGDDVSIPVVDPKKESGIGQQKLKIPAGTQPGATLRLSGYGLPYRQGGRGDAYVIIKILIPKKLSRQERETLKNFI